MSNIFYSVLIFLIMIVINSGTLLHAKTFLETENYREVSSEYNICFQIQSHADLNKDNRISSIDLLKLMIIYIRKNRYEIIYDFNKDGKVDIADSSILRLFILNRLECQQEYSNSY